MLISGNADHAPWHRLYLSNQKKTKTEQDYRPHGVELHATDCGGESPEWGHSPITPLSKMFVANPLKYSNVTVFNYRDFMMRDQ